MNNVLEVDGIFKTYPSGIEALKKTDLVIPGKKLTSLIGPSGCGKTTLLRIIAGIEPPTGGEIRIEGKVYRAGLDEDRPVAMVFQSYALFPHMNVLANVAYGLRMSEVSGAESIAKKILSDLGMQGKEYSEISTLSGGQQQRVALARALVLRPKILLLDEPLSNLDTKLRHSVRDDLRRLQIERDLTVLYVTHDQHEAMAVSDHLVVMNEGDVIQSGSPEHIYTKPTSEFVAKFMGDVDVFDVAADVNGVINLGGFQLLTDAKEFVGKPLKVVVRPDAWQLGYASLTGIPGRIIQRTYLGLTIEYIVETSLGAIRASDRGTSISRDVGSPVSLYLDAQKVSIVIAHPTKDAWTSVSV